MIKHRPYVAHTIVATTYLVDWEISYFDMIKELNFNNAWYLKLGVVQSQQFYLDQENAFLLLEIDEGFPKRNAILRNFTNTFNGMYY